MNLVLIGMMGSGKSTVGRLLAGALGRPFYDTDTLVELAAQRLIRQIFAAEGEAGFRRRETLAIAEAMSGDGRVIATGGGAVLAPANRALLRQNSLVIWLDAEPEELYRRAMQQGAAARPLLAGADPLAKLIDLRAERAEAYAAAADERIDVTGLTPAQIVAEILVRFGADKGDTGQCH